MKSFPTISTVLMMLCTISITLGQEPLPYSEIGDYPEAYTAGAINARYLDGLGYRYYWATNGLTEKDLSYRPSTEARDLMETLEHIYGLSDMILNGTMNKVNSRPIDFSAFTFESLRAKTLNNFRQASQQLSEKTSDEIAGLKIIFGSGDSKREIPFWNLINGPISDAIYHTGQIVTLRRASGNPMNPKVNVFMGKNGE